ncbi:MAG: class I SAM-dependent methyltransferase [Cellvibrionales bacterium]|nr:class I SAM-dependent methyltransferase [Cellvibrionales bacterium]
MKVITKFFKKRKKKKEKYSDLQIQEALTQLREALIMQPLDAILHFQYAQAASKANLPFLAYAELKTASVLGLPDKDGQQLYQEIISKVPDLLEMNHNQWFRLHSIASKLKEKADGKKLRILDVGGGDGSLAAFLPEMDYCLVEPDTNGISGTHLPFADQSFDYVVSCHVLEHIPIESRELFLDQLISKASKGLLLLNPFHVEEALLRKGCSCLLMLPMRDGLMSTLNAAFRK